ncbi:MAG: hypothetical protein K8F25_11560 [Fimbriimonadaceae bacterium]|nr:hypothetical protein [Alphaproteobacteria bacterium]
MSNEKEEDETPYYLKGDEVVGLKNMGPEDTVWIGEDGKLDPDVVIADYGHDPETPLVWIVQAIIDAHPSDNPWEDHPKRLRQAISVLTNSGGAGRSPVDYNDLLLEIARRYYASHYEEKKEPELRPIVRAVVIEMGVDVISRRNIQRDSLIEKLEDKFNADKDLWLSRATMDDDSNRMDKARAVKNIIKEMNKLGIEANVEMVKPRRLKKNVQP